MRKLLVVLAVFILLSLTVSAYDISTADDMIALMNGTLSWDGDYTLTADIICLLAVKSL